MKKTLIAANWKSNKTKTEAKNWLEEIFTQTIPEHLEVVIFCPFTLLDTISGYIRVNSLPFKLGAQDISPFDCGAYTGEVSGAQIKEFADYVLIGHSERRSNFSESDKLLEQKVNRALEAGLEPIFFVQNSETVIPPGIKTIVYEPPGSISTVSGGTPDSPENVSSNIEKINAGRSFESILYGGSVNSNNVKSYLNLKNISGVVVGAQSLDPKSFIEVIKNAI